MNNKTTIAEVDNTEDEGWEDNDSQLYCHNRMSTYQPVEFPPKPVSCLNRGCTAGAMNNELVRSGCSRNCVMKLHCTSSPLIALTVHS